MKIRISVLFVLAGFFSFSQGTYQRSIGEQGDDIAFSVCNTLDSGVAVLGVTKSFNSSNKVFLTILDTLGAPIFTNVYGGDQVDVGKEIKQTRDGGYIVVGNTTSFGAVKKDVFLMKLDGAGKVQWAYTYGGNNNDYGAAVEQTFDGGYIIAGETNSFGNNTSDVLLLKTDANGKLQWLKTLGGGNTDHAFDVRETVDGFVLGIETNSYGAGEWDVALIKTDKLGETLWFEVFGGAKDEYGYAVEITKDEGIVLVGSSFSNTLGAQDMYIIRTDKVGKVLWSKMLGDKMGEQAHGVYQTKDGGFILTGFSNSFSNQLNGEDVIMVRLTEQGILRWSKTYGGKFGDYGLAMNIGLDGDFIVVGETVSFNGRSDKDAYVLRLNDNTKSQTCEQSRVQLTSYKAEFKVQRVDVPSKPASYVETQLVNPEVKEVLLFENIVCQDDEQVIKERR